MSVQHLANVEPLRRTVLLVAGVTDLETRVATRKRPGWRAGNEARG